MFSSPNHVYILLWNQSVFFLPDQPYFNSLCRLFSTWIKPSMLLCLVTTNKDVLLNTKEGVNIYFPSICFLLFSSLFSVGCPCGIPHLMGREHTRFGWNELLVEMNFKSQKVCKSLQSFFSKLHLAWKLLKVSPWSPSTDA